MVLETKKVFDISKIKVGMEIVKVSSVNWASGVYMKITEVTPYHIKTDKGYTITPNDDLGRYIDVEAMEARKEANSYMPW